MSKEPWDRIPKSNVQYVAISITCHSLGPLQRIYKRAWKRGPLRYRTFWKDNEKVCSDRLWIVA